MARLTRSEMRNQTKERLLQAAAALFVEKGFSNVTIEDISDAAGFSRGAFYSNFSSKQEILFETLKRFSQAPMTSFEGHLADAPDIPTYLSRSAAVLARQDEVPFASGLMIQAYELAAYDGAFRERLVQQANERIMQAARFYEAKLPALVSYGETLALVSTMIRLGHYRLQSAGFSAPSLEHVLRVTLIGLVGEEPPDTPS